MKLVSVCVILFGSVALGDIVEKPDLSYDFASDNKEKLQITNIYIYAERERERERFNKKKIR